MESICLQINDIAMGTKMAPSYANIFIETIKVFFRVGPLRVSVVYETKAGNLFVG
jgi:hypothetical protein